MQHLARDYERQGALLLRIVAERCGRAARLRLLGACSRERNTKHHHHGCRRCRRRCRRSDRRRRRLSSSASRATTAAATAGAARRPAAQCAQALRCVVGGSGTAESRAGAAAEERTDTACLRPAPPPARLRLLACGCCGGEQGTGQAVLAGARHPREACQCGSVGLRRVRCACGAGRSRPRGPRRAAAGARERDSYWVGCGVLALDVRVEALVARGPSRGELARAGLAGAKEVAEEVAALGGAHMVAALDAARLRR